MGPMNLIHNERIKLLATFLNGIALAFAIGGAVGPAVSGGLHGTGWLASLAWFGLGLGLHLCAHGVLGRLKP